MFCVRERLARAEKKHFVHRARPRDCRDQKPLEYDGERRLPHKMGQQELRSLPLPEPSYLWRASRAQCLDSNLSMNGIGRSRDQEESYARSEEHTSELQSLMRISYAVFCLKKKKKLNTKTN